MIGVWVLVGTLVVTSVFGVAWRSAQGRVRAPRPAPRPTLPEPLRALVDTRSAVTLIQLSTTFCAPCRHTRVLLADLAARTAGLAHVDFDVTQRPEVATALRVTRTPTTLAVDPAGVELLRISGVPRRDTLLQAVQPHLP